MLRPSLAINDSGDGARKLVGQSVPRLQTVSDLSRGADTVWPGFHDRSEDWRGHAPYRVRNCSDIPTCPVGKFQDAIAVRIAGLTVFRTIRADEVAPDTSFHGFCAVGPLSAQSSQNF